MHVPGWIRHEMRFFLAEEAVRKACRAAFQWLVDALMMPFRPMMEAVYRWTAIAGYILVAVAVVIVFFAGWKFERRPAGLT